MQDQTKAAQQIALQQAAKNALGDAHAFAGAVAVAPTSPVVMDDKAPSDYPFENYVFIKPDGKLTKTPNGIHLAGGEKEQNSATVLALSMRSRTCHGCNGSMTQLRHDDNVLIPCPMCLPSIALANVKVGDRIMCAKVFSFEVDGKTHFVTREADIICALPPKAEPLKISE